MSVPVLTRTRDGVTEKRCTGCLRWLRTDGTERGFDKDPRRHLGLRNDCKQCRNDRRQPRRRNYSEDWKRRKARLMAMGAASSRANQ